jgi:hypothetical protein
MAVKRPVQSFLFVSCRVQFLALVGRADAVVGTHIYRLVLYAPPQPLNKDMITPAACAVDANLDAMVFHQAGELAALVGVEYVWPPYQLRVSYTPSRQHSVVSILDSRHAGTRRLAQSVTAQRYTKPRHNGWRSRLETLPCFQIYPRVTDYHGLQEDRMSASMLPSKGQTTIPKDIRKRLNHFNHYPGDRLEFLIDEDGRALVLPTSIDVSE